MQSENRQTTGGVGNHKRTNCSFFLVKSVSGSEGGKGFLSFLHQVGKAKPKQP